MLIGVERFFFTFGTAFAIIKMVKIYNFRIKGVEQMNLLEQLTTKNRVLTVDVNDILKNPNQPRKLFEESALMELAESIRECGIIQPLTVRKLNDNTYELIAGERRLKAAKLIGMKEVPVLVMNVNEDASALMALIENLQRKDLTFFEEAVSYDKLMREFAYTQDELALKLGKKQSTIANKLRLLKLSDEIKSRAVEYHLSERHCRTLLRAETEELRMKVLNAIIQRNLTVSETEQYMDRLLSEQASRQKKEKRMIPLFRDIRIFSNTVKQAVEMMNKAGVATDSKKKETDHYIEYIIRIDKAHLAEQKRV